MSRPRERRLYRNQERDLDEESLDRSRSRWMWPTCRDLEGKGPGKYNTTLTPPSSTPLVSSPCLLSDKFNCKPEAPIGDIRAGQCREVQIRKEKGGEQTRGEQQKIPRTGSYRSPVLSP